MKEREGNKPPRGPPPQKNPRSATGSVVFT